MRINGYFDGSCGPQNPGGTAAWGFVINDFAGHRLHAGRGTVGRGPGMTNNVAEASGAAALLKHIIDEMPHVTEVFIHGDSNIVIRKLGRKGRSDRTAQGHYVPYLNEALRLADKLRARCGVYFIWIPRERNAEADRLSKPGEER